MKGPAMTSEKSEQTKVPNAAHELHETELIQDLEIEDAAETDAVKGGNGGGAGAGAGKVTLTRLSSLGEL
jgi:hypothetical protein